jgi:hypothetical protein
MGVMNFQVSASPTADTAERLRCAFLGGGYDHSPVPTKTELANDLLRVRRDSDESGFLTVGWDVSGAGRLLASTSTLMERPAPYRLAVELARGKVNQVRTQAAEWKQLGYEIRPEVEEHIRAATALFGKAVLETDAAESERFASQAMSMAYETADAMACLYVEQVFATRHANKERTHSQLACRLSEVPPVPLDGIFRETFNSVCVPISWRATEPTEANYNWTATDAVLDWAQDQQLPVTAGPLIDFSRFGLPEWLHAWDGDLPALASFMCDYLEMTITRYRGRIRRWVISAGSNCSLALGLSEDDLIRLTARLAEAVWGVDSQLEVLIGLAQPWGEYLAGEYFNYSPFVFADTLLRAGLPLAGFELEWHMGVAPRGAWCRDPLDASRQLDMFSLLNCPLQVALSYPSDSAKDPLADPSLSIGAAGWWHGLTPPAQAEWAEIFTSLALAKGYVAGTCWDHFRDSAPHRFPNAGLVDANGAIKPALEKLRLIRENYLQGGQDTMIM